MHLVDWKLTTLAKILLYKSVLVGALNLYRTKDFLRIESTAGQRCARKSTEFASGSKIVDENRGDVDNFLVTQDSTHRGFC